MNTDPKEYLPIHEHPPEPKTITIWQVTEKFSGSVDYFETEKEAEDWKGALEEGLGVVTIKPVDVRLSPAGVCVAMSQPATSIQ